MSFSEERRDLTESLGHKKRTNPSLEFQERGATLLADLGEEKQLSWFTKKQHTTGGQYLFSITWNSRLQHAPVRRRHSDQARHETSNKIFEDQRQDRPATPGRVAAEESKPHVNPAAGQQTLRALLLLLLLLPTRYATLSPPKYNPPIPPVGDSLSYSPNYCTNSPTVAAPCGTWGHLRNKI